MSINLPDQVTRNQYVANGVLTTFAYTFKIYKPEDVAVYVTLDGATADPKMDKKLLTTDYTVTDAGTLAGGTVVFNDGKIPHNLAIVTIVRDIPASLTSEFSDPQTINGENLDNEFERTMLITQQNKTNTSSTTLNYPINSINPNNAA